MNIITDCIREDGEYSQLLDLVRKNFRDKPLPILASGLSDGSSDILTSALAEDVSAFSEGCAVVICPDEKECRRVAATLEHVGIGAAVFEPRDLSFYDITASHDYEYGRLHVLSGIVGGAYRAVVTTPDALLGYTIPREVLEAHTLRLDFDTEADPAELAEKLISSGYARVEMVDGVGQFAMRGGIIDVFPPFGSFTDTDGEQIEGAYALRVELFGDQIDRMGLFDTGTQRINTQVSRASVPPAREILVSSEAREGLIRAVKSLIKTNKDAQSGEALGRELAALEGGTEINFGDKYISLIYPQKSTLTDYFDGRTLVIVRSSTAVYDRIKSSEWQSGENIKSMLGQGLIAGKYAEYSKPAPYFDAFLDENVTVHVNSLTYNAVGKRVSGIFGFRTKHTFSYAEKLQLLCEDIDAYIRGGYRIIVLTGNETEAVNLKELFEDFNIKAVTSKGSCIYTAKDLTAGTVLIKPDDVLPGFELIPARIAVLSTCNGTGSTGVRRGSLRKSNRKKTDAGKAILSWNELNVGDLVVHETYGIARYLGIKNEKTFGVARDFICLQYDGSEKLFLPVEQMDRISKYIGPHADDGMVKLSKYGSTEWNKTKSRAKGAVAVIAKELIKLYAERMRRPGIAFPADDNMQRDFEATFEFDETESQLDAVEDIKKDMMKAVPMDRLLCGDVGYGKTEVALRAAFKAILGGKQVALLCPTTLLALQHYETAVSRMRSFAVSVDMVSRFRTPKEQERTLRRLERGEVDLLIGTHRLLGKDIKFHDLGLLIVDEEQRFGVAQKEKLKQIAANIDVLTLTATPIPRTLNMAMGGIRDISVLDEAPGNRLPVQTYVLEYEELIIYEAIRRELRRGGQVFYLHNAVETIDRVAARLSEAIPDARITVAHGKMDKDELEDIWEQMLKGEIDILVCTTIIETGIDIPNANTLIVENSDRLGLSQLHQIRGRIGRSARRAFAYFTYPKSKVVTEIAQKRLEAIKEYAEFGAGFRIAMRDMEIRGVGNLLGAEQHGHMDAIGYDLYIRLLNEAVLEERGEKREEKRECVISLTLDAFIPDRYVHYPAQRMALYKRIALIETEYDRQDIADEMLDRFGDIPRETLNLLSIALVRANAVKCGIKAIRQEAGCVNVYPEKFNFQTFSNASKVLEGRARACLSGEAHIIVRLKPGDDPCLLLNRYFEKIAQN